MKDDIIKQKVKEAYGKIALVGSSLDGCCAPGECCGSSSGSSNGSQAMMSPLQIAKNIGYNTNDLNSIPESSILGVRCGPPVNFAYPVPLIIGVEIFASAMLMSVIYVVVYTKGLGSSSGIVICGIVGLDIFFLAFISGASMNPGHSLAPALVSGVLNNLWLYRSATFVGTSIVAIIFRRVMVANKIGFVTHLFRSPCSNSRL